MGTWPCGAGSIRIRRVASSVHLGHTYIHQIRSKVYSDANRTASRPLSATTATWPAAQEADDDARFMAMSSTRSTRLPDNGGRPAPHPSAMARGLPAMAAQKR